MRSKQVIFTLLTVIILLLVVLMIGEGMARVFFQLKATPNPPYNTAVPDTLLGWRCKPSYVFDGKMKDADGTARQVHYTVDQRGFRSYGSPDSTLRRVWFIGDSYTQAVEVSDGETYYSQAAKQFPMNLYASGRSGWGNLQQYLLLDAYIDSIRPDVIVWQVCANDCIDNYEPLAREAVYEVDQRRPYMRLDGSIYYSQDTVSLHKRLSRYSSLFKALHMVYGKAVHRLGLSRGAEYQMAHLGRAYAPYDESQQVTAAIFRKILARIGPDVRLYLLDATDLPPTHPDWQALGQQLGIPVIESVPQALRVAQAKGQVVHAHDGWHWNPAGHQAAADSLVSFLRSQFPAP